MPRNFIALIHKDADSDYGVSFPDLPGVVTAGVDLDEARVMAEEALALHLEGMEGDRDPIPEPSSLEAIMQDRENRDAVAILVKAPAKAAKAVRINVTVPEDDLEAIDRYAAEQGYTRSGFLVHAAKKLAADVVEGVKASGRGSQEAGDIEIPKDFAEQVRAILSEHGDLLFDDAVRIVLARSRAGEEAEEVLIDAAKKRRAAKQAADAAVAKRRARAAQI